MLLALDIGNSRVGLGLFAGSRLLRRWDTDPDDPPAIPAGDAGQVRAVAVSSVNPAAGEAWRRFCRQQLGLAPFELSGQTPTRMPVHYRSPGRLGPDRLAAALAAREKHGSPVLVAHFGTATVLDAVSPDGEFLGGAIAPGIGLSLRALAGETALLPQVEPARPAHAVGGDTEESLLSGVVGGAAAMIAGLAEAIRREINAPAPLILTGGFSGLVAPLLEHRALEPDLVLEGLRLAWEDANKG